MIHDAVNEILKVEEEVSGQIARTMEDAKETVMQAEKEAEKIRADAVVRMKEENRRSADVARQDAEKQYNQIMASGKQNAQRLLSGTDVTSAADFIKQKVLSAYVDR